MNARLIAKWNSRVKPEDTVYHIGDFCNKGKCRGVERSRKSAVYWESQLNGKIIHIRGNHDSNNGVKVALEDASIIFSNKLWYLIHKPLLDGSTLPARCSAVLCGHVHEKWSERFVPGTRIPMINVGVDVRKLAPIKLDEVTGVYHRFLNKEKE